MSEFEVACICGRLVSFPSLGSTHYSPIKDPSLETHLVEARICPSCFRTITIERHISAAPIVDGGPLVGAHDYEQSPDDTGCKVCGKAAMDHDS